MSKNIDQTKLYSVSDIVKEGLITPPSGSDNPLTVYQHVLKVIKSGKIVYRDRDTYQKGYSILGKDIIRYKQKYEQGNE